MLTPENSPDLFQLTKPINERFIEPPPQGKYGSYVPHYVISQIILASTGPFDWELVEILRGSVPGMTTKRGDAYPELTNAIIGCVYRMRLQIDGRTVTIEESGSCDAEAFENNDADRLKKASSDALKRCAMRLGVGIHLWCKRDNQFIIHKSLVFQGKGEGEDVEVEADGGTTGVEDQDADDDAE